MAVEVSAPGAVSPFDDDSRLYDELARLKDDVLAGRNASLVLNAAAVERLKASLLVPDAPTNGLSASRPNGVPNGSTHTTNEAQPVQPTSSTFFGLPGLQAAGASSISNTSQVYGAKSHASGDLDPIFLEKSDSLVRAEGQLKRQRIDRDLQEQAEQRKYTTRDKEPGVDATPQVDIDTVLKSALERVKHVSGLKTEDANSSFDENDYYSSQVQSDWSSDASSKDGSDRAAGAFTADFERLDGGAEASTARSKPITKPHERIDPRAPAPPPLAGEDEDMYDPEDEEDDDYMPPDVPAFGGAQPYAPPTTRQQDGPPLPEDDNSDYEPGEITAESTVATPNEPPQPSAQPPRQIIRNHLTHIAAPQPNRVSPLANAKAPSYELELVNGRPEVVRKPQQYPNYVPSRVSTASPPGNGNLSNKKKKGKKRKRDNEPMGRAKRRQQRQNVAEPAPRMTHQQTYIKDEPVSPVLVADAPVYAGHPQPATQQRPIEIDVGTPRRAPVPQYLPEPPRSALRYEYDQPAGSNVRLASPSYQRPVQRDTQDLRRVASMHYAQRPASPTQVGRFSPLGSYQRRTTSMTYGDPHLAQAGQFTSAAPATPTYAEQPHASSAYYTRAERSRSPPRLQEYQDPYAQPPPTAIAMLPPPAPPPKRVIVDQYGNRYMEAGPAPEAAAPAPAQAYSRAASVAPVEMRAYPDMRLDRAPSRMSVAYAPQAPPTVQYEPAYGAMPPPPAKRQPEPQYEYVDANGGYRYAPEPPQYAPQPTSPIYQEVRSYDQMPPPPLPAREPTSPVYAPTRSYSVRPEEQPPPQYVPASYVRQGSVAPIQYVRQEPAPAPAPSRAVSVMPGMDYRSATQPAPQRTYMQAPQQAVRYVDQYGNEVFPRQVSEMRYQ